MSRSYEDYARGRRRGMSADGRTALAVFTSAHTAGRSVCDARRGRNMTQQQLADISGVAQGDISRIERGLITPTLPTLMRLVEALDARIALILNEDTPTAS
jgi:XRE family transcriptional regulator, regulator of sulfur utilization